jgi:Cu2+-exporting ATPase
LGDSPAAPLDQISEIAGQGVVARWTGQEVRLGRGAWLGADFDDLGLRIGTAAPRRIEASETPRAGVRSALARLNLPAEIVTGDAAAPAQRFADDLGIGFRADVRPEAKLAYLQQLSKDGERVLMVGDGLNDTAALAAAHASIAPASALDASRSASDIVVLKDSFEDLPMLLRISRMACHLSQQNFAIAAIYNGVSIPLAIAGYATPLAAALAMSISSITVLLNSQRIRFAK